MNPLLSELMQADPLTPKQIDTFLRTNNFPIVEGNSATFIFRGEADQVNLQHWIYGLPSARPFKRLEFTDLWYLEFELPRESRVEYKLEILQNGSRDWILDPLNPRRAHDPFGANSVCYGDGYERPDWTLTDPDARQGTVESFSISSRAFGDQRHAKLYIPARFRSSRRYPLLIVHDGDDYLRYAQLKTVLDNLIHRLEVAPLLVAFTQTPYRLGEYANDIRHARFLAEELVPFLEKKYPLIRHPAARGLMGASFGAVAALSAAWTYPGFFGRLILQSGSFMFTEIGPHHRGGREFDPVVRFVNAFRANPGRPAEKIFMNCGIYESLIYENRSMVPLLQKAGMDLRFLEARDGHNWENWRDRSRDALSWLFPGPLWMVYE